MSNTILNTVIGILSTLVTGIITVVIVPALSTWLKSKTQSEKLHSAIDDITYTVQTTVDQVEQTFVKHCKQCGEWDSDAIDNAKKLAVDTIVTNLTVATKQIIESQGTDIADVVSRYIEAYIQSTHMS